MQASPLFTIALLNFPRKLFMLILWCHLIILVQLFWGLSLNTYNNERPNLL